MRASHTRQRGRKRRYLHLRDSSYVVSRWRSVNSGAKVLLRSWIGFLCLECARQQGLHLRHWVALGVHWIVVSIVVMIDGCSQSKSSSSHTLHVTVLCRKISATLLCTAVSSQEVFFWEPIRRLLWRAWLSYCSFSTSSARFVSIFHSKTVDQDLVDVFCYAT